MEKMKYPLRLDNPRAWRTYLGGAGLDRLHGVLPGEDGHFPEEWIMSVVAARNAGREDIKDEGMSHIRENGRTLKEQRGFSTVPTEKRNAGTFLRQEKSAGKSPASIMASKRALPEKNGKTCLTGRIFPVCFLPCSVLPFNRATRF